MAPQRKAHRKASQLSLPHLAAGPYLGFSLQGGRMLELLLAADADEVISLEHFDDLGVESTKGVKKKAIQAKNSEKGNPVSNGASDFWKTFQNWIIAIKKGVLDPRVTIFEIYTFSAKAGVICELFSKAKTLTEAEAACVEAKRILTKSGKRLSVRAAEVLRTESKVLLPLIVAFQFNSGTGDKRAEMLHALRNCPVPQDSLEVVMNFLVGWIKTTTDALLQKGEVPQISKTAFLQQLVTFTRKLDSTFILSGVPEDPDLTNAEHEERKFVKQLRIIKLGDETVLRAISTFLRAKACQTIWSEQMVVNETSYDEFEMDIRNNWANTKIAHEVLHAGQAEVNQGKLLFVDCLKFRPPLQGRIVPSEYAEGCHHALADELEIGWHPKFKDLIEG